MEISRSLFVFQFNTTQRVDATVHYGSIGRFWSPCPWKRGRRCLEEVVKAARFELIRLVLNFQGRYVTDVLKRSRGSGIHC